MRRSHIVDDLRGRIEKFNDDVRWLGALPGEAVLGCHEGAAEFNLVSWILRWKL